MPRVVFHQISKLFADSVTALADFSLEVADGEFVVLVGPSGCGKTTTLRLLAGLEMPTAGDLFIGDRRVNDLPPKQRDVAMVFQNYALYPHMSVYENLAFPLKVRKFAKAEIAARVTKTAATLGLGKMLDRKPKTLSGGERQRVAVGRALVRQPQVYLFDEPLSNLDAKLRGQLRGEFLTLKRQLGATSLYVTHDQTEALTLGDRVVILKEGCIQQIGRPEELYFEPANLFVATFIGSPEMNLLQGKLVRADGLVFESSVNLPIPAEIADGIWHWSGKALCIGIRPENLFVAETKKNLWSGSFSVQLEYLEPLGGELLMHCRADSQGIIARLKNEAKIFEYLSVRIGASIALTFEWSRVHFFDPISEKRIDLSGRFR